MFGFHNKKVVFVSSNKKAVKIFDIINLYTSTADFKSKYTRKNVAYLKKNKIKKRVRKILHRRTSCIVSIVNKKSKSNKFSRLNKTAYNLDIIHSSSNLNDNSIKDLVICRYLLFFYRLGLDFFYKNKVRRVTYNAIL